MSKYTVYSTLKAALNSSAKSDSDGNGVGRERQQGQATGTDGAENNKVTYFGDENTNWSNPRSLTTDKRRGNTQTIIMSGNDRIGKSQTQSQSQNVTKTTSQAQMDTRMRVLARIDRNVMAEESYESQRAKSTQRDVRRKKKSRGGNLKAADANHHKHINISRGSESPISIYDDLNPSRITRSISSRAAGAFPRMVRPELLQLVGPSLHESGDESSYPNEDIDMYSDSSILSNSTCMDERSCLEDGSGQSEVSSRRSTSSNIVMNPLLYKTGSSLSLSFSDEVGQLNDFRSVSASNPASDENCTRNRGDSGCQGKQDAERRYARPNMTNSAAAESRRIGHSKAATRFRHLNNRSTMPIADEDSEIELFLASISRNRRKAASSVVPLKEEYSVLNTQTTKEDNIKDMLNSGSNNNAIRRNTVLEYFLAVLIDGLSVHDRLKAFEEMNNQEGLLSCLAALLQLGVIFINRVSYICGAFAGLCEAAMSAAITLIM